MITFSLSTGTKDRYLFLGNQRLGVTERVGTSTPELFLNFSDHLNSSSVTTDSQGNVTNLIDYYPYGTDRVNVKNQSFSPTYKFTDQENDPESGLMYYDARYYRPDIGRFTQSDPLSLFINDEEKVKQETRQELVDILANPQYLNSYSYSINNPVVMKDENGEFAGQFGRDMASGQRTISSFFHKAANFTNNQGGLFNKISSFVSNSLGDFVDNVANVFDPDQKAGTRMLALGLMALDTSTGGEGKAISKALIKAGDRIAGLRVTEHAAEQFVQRNMRAGQIASALEDGVKYLDTKTGNLLHIVGEKGKGGYTIVTDRAQKVLVSTENFIRNLTPKHSPNRFKLLK